MHMLQFYKGDKAELESLITSTNELVEGNYTPESWQTLVDAIETANTVMNNVNAMQEEVDKAKAALTKAMNQLILKTKAASAVKTGNISNINQLVMMLLTGFVLIEIKNKKIIR